MNRPVMAANWKMNNGPTAAREFMHAFLNQYPRQNDRTILIFPPALSLHAVAESIADRQDILLGVQNVHWADQGAYTGELSVGMARDAGARVVLVGHSERRQVFGETSEETAMKCAAVERGGLTPLLCVGEKLEHRDSGIEKEVVMEQLRVGFSAMTQLRTREVMVAYEPVWAIGTGRTATPADATAMHTAIRTELGSICGDRSRTAAILYGGSVNASNARSLISAAEIDGLLVGGASVDTGSWLTVARS